MLAPRERSKSLLQIGCGGSLRIDSSKCPVSGRVTETWTDVPIEAASVDRSGEHLFN